MEHEEFGLCCSRRIRASDKRRETRAQKKYWRRGQVPSRTPAREKSQAAIATQRKGVHEKQAGQQIQSGSGRMEQQIRAVATEGGRAHDRGKR